MTIIGYIIYIKQIGTVLLYTYQQNNQTIKYSTSQGIKLQSNIIKSIQKEQNYLLQQLQLYDLNKRQKRYNIYKNKLKFINLKLNNI